MLTCSGISASAGILPVYRLMALFDEMSALRTSFTLYVDG